VSVCVCACACACGVCMHACVSSFLCVVHLQTCVPSWHGCARFFHVCMCVHMKVFTCVYVCMHV